VRLRVYRRIETLRIQDQHRLRELEDTTQALQRSEEGLRANQERYRELFENASEGERLIPTGIFSLKVRRAFVKHY
jgi:hypothetical protein